MQDQVRSLDLKRDSKVVGKLTKTKWFHSLPVYKHWKATRSPKTRQLILDEVSFDISLALRGKRLQVFLYKNSERGQFSEYVRKNGHEWAVCVLEEVQAPGAPTCMSFDPWWMSVCETKEEAVEMCAEMGWQVVAKHKPDDFAV